MSMWWRCSCEGSVLPLLIGAVVLIIVAVAFLNFLWRRRGENNWESLKRDMQLQKKLQFGLGADYFTDYLLQDYLGPSY